MKNREYATPFSVLHAASLLSHTTRIRKFREAITRIVTADDYVIDLGTGSGILAILAAREGARVTAVDINQDSLLYAKKAAELNDVAKNIEFVHSHFADYRPSERADVVLCEMLSSVMLIEQQVAASNYAVENLLKPSGHIIPEQVWLFVGPVENEIIWNRFSVEGLQFPRVPQSAEHGQSVDLANLSELAYINFRLHNRNIYIERNIKFKIVQDGTIHGIQGLFEAGLHEEISVTVRDGWRELFMPLAKPVEVDAGDTFCVRIGFTPGEYDSLVIEPTTD